MIFFVYLGRPGTQLVSSHLLNLLLSLVLVVTGIGDIRPLPA